MKRTRASGTVKRVKEVFDQRPSVPPSADVSESFRRARSSVSDIAADLKELRQRAPSAVNRARHHPKSD
jgi:hypothetical protein